MRNKGTFCIVLGLILLAGALGLTAYNKLDDRRAGGYASAAREKLVQTIPAQEDQSPASDPAEMLFPDYVLDPTRDMPEREIDGVRYVAVLDIPALGLSLPVISEWSYDLLRLGPCRYSGSAYENDLVIAAHNYTSHFGSLRQLSPGDAVILTDMDGNIFTYEAADFHTLSPNEVDAMVNNEWDLTLFTCTVGGQTRFAVGCTLIE